MLEHAPELASVVTSNPLYFYAGLTDGARPSVLEGLPGSADPNAGFTTQALGGLAARDLLHGRMPWWNPYSGVGLPLAAEMQGSALFLPFVLLLHRSDGVLYLKIAMQVMAGWATCALLRQLGLGGRAALTGAVLYELNGTFALLAHAPIMPLPFLPLLLFGIERARAHAGAARTGGFCWIAVATAYSLYAGFPETAFIDGILCAVWGAYRCCTVAAAARWRLAVKMLAGAVAGVLLAAPTLLPFLEFLPHSYTGMHGLGTFAMHPANFAMALLPYVLGPIGYAGRWMPWAGAGGYLSISLALLASLALLRRGPDFGLRLVLAGWILAATARAANVPVAADLFDLIPFVRDSWFSRYVPPSCELAAIVLVACAIDDWHSGARFSRRVLLCMAAMWGAVTLYALLQAAPAIRVLLADRRHYALYPALSLVVGVAAAVACVWLVAGRSGRARSTALCGVVTVEALGLSMFPLLCAISATGYDRPAVEFLRHHLGLSRFYTLGPFTPNYGALFETASINHNYLPTPRAWVDYVRAHLQPTADDTVFNGIYARPGFGDDSPAMTLRHRLAAYAAVGVKYVVTPPDQNPFLDTLGAAGEPGPRTVLALAPGRSVSGAIAGSGVKSGTLDRVLVMIGTYMGAADGVLAVQLCTLRQCAVGVAKLADTADNASIAVTLAAPLQVRDGDVLRYTIGHQGGTHDVAIYQVGGTAPDVRAVYAAMTSAPTKVYADKVMSIYEIADPAPYFSVRGGTCVLTPLGRLKVQADCRTAATLVRRELFFPGWRAQVNGGQAKIGKVEEIFQAVALPAGPAIVRFSYAPRFIGSAYGAFGVGVLAVGLAATARRGGNMNPR